MRELILHIGAHKTATTTIQAALQRYAGRLAGLDIEVVTIADKQNVHKVSRAGAQRGLAARRVQTARAGSLC